MRTVTNRTCAAAALALAGALLLPAAACADGCMLPPWYSELWESSQIAFIRHDAGREDLTILPGFHGDARQFAWIVPVPSLPELGADDVALFHQLSTMTQPVYRNRDGWDCFEDDDLVYDSGQPNDGVEIISDEVVGIYRAMILGADDAQALVDSLTVWEYLHDGNTDDVTPVLTDYVDRGWYFVTLKVDEDRFLEEYPYVGDYWYGQMEPIRLEFDSEEMVYPLRISAISAAPSADVVLYAVADHRVTYPTANTLYANRISAGELDAIGRTYPLVAERLREGDFLTKLARTYTPSQMTDDLVLEPAESDAEYRAVRYGGVPWIGALFALSLVGWPAWKLRKSRRRLRSADRP